MAHYDDIDQAFAKFRAAATADRPRRMVFRGAVFADEAEDVAMALRSLAVDRSESHPLVELLDAMSELQSCEAALKLNADHCASLADAEMRLDAFHG